MTNLRYTVAVLGCGLTATAIAVKQASPTLPAAVDYTIGYAPWWVGLTGAALGAATVLGLAGEARRSTANTRARSRALTVAAWLATAFLLWAAAGVVLDGFRAFFAVTGIPADDFAIVDWPGFAARFLSLVACGAVLSVVANRAIASRGGCPGCGAVAGDKSGTRLPGLVTIGLVWPYPLLKTYWWLGGSLARPVGFDEGPPVGELLGAAAATGLCLAMLWRWWRRGVLRRLTLMAGGSATAILLSMGALSFFGTLSQLLGLTDGPVDFDSDTAVVMVSVVYGSWLALGIGFAVLTWRYRQATRPGCPRCAGFTAESPSGRRAATVLSSARPLEP